MEEKLTCVPHIKVVVSEDDIETGALKILRTIRANWEEDSIQFKLLTDGITNKLVACKPVDAEDPETVLVRIYGNKTDLLIDRKAETRNIILLHSLGLAPDLYATFSNGLAYKFIPGCTLNDNSVRNPNIYQLVATKMAKFHKVCKGHEKNHKPCIWAKLQKFLDLVPESFSDSVQDKRYRETGIPKSKIIQEIKELRSILENLNSPIVFAHNDLLLGNVIFTESENCVTFIDYEYADFNYQGFDIGNHFAEFVGLSDVDYSKYPTKDLQLDWLSIYLKEFNGKTPTNEEVEKLYIQVNQFTLLAHIFWGVWALIQAEHSYIDFDFIEYAAIRFNEYFEKKNIFLSLKSTS